MFLATHIVHVHGLLAISTIILFRPVMFSGWPVMPSALCVSGTNSPGVCEAKVSEISDIVEPESSSAGNRRPPMCRLIREFRCALVEATSSGQRLKRFRRGAVAISASSDGYNGLSVGGGGARAFPHDFVG